MKFMPTAAKRQPALTIYKRSPGQPDYRPLVIDVLRVEEGAVTEITAFLLPELFREFGSRTRCDGRRLGVGAALLPRATSPAWVRDLGDLRRARLQARLRRRRVAGRDRRRRAWGIELECRGGSRQRFGRGEANFEKRDEAAARWLKIPEDLRRGLALPYAVVHRRVRAPTPA
jgi:hypothetical protein